jgi:hypothetical protein
MEDANKIDLTPIGFSFALGDKVVDKVAESVNEQLNQNKPKVPRVSSDRQRSPASFYRGGMLRRNFPQHSQYHFSKRTVTK